MTRLTRARALALAGVIAAGAALAACGKTGELQRPAPLFGKARTAPPAPGEDKHRQDPSRPVSTIDPRDQILNPAPPRAVPIQGQSPDPVGTRPQTALPDPYAYPR